jgi:MarR family 2-MHQ and catechol resistance regulon transcriptional repressor
MKEVLMDYIYELINKISEAQSLILEEKQNEYGLSTNELKSMEIIANSKSPKMMKDIAQLMSMTKGGMTFLVNKLEEKGLVERKQNAYDRRAIYIHFTPHGQKVFEQYNKGKYKVLHKWVEDMDPQVKNILQIELHKALKMVE